MKPAKVEYLFEQYGEVLTPSEVATAIRASDSYVCGLISGGELPCFRIGSHFRILKRDIVAYLKSSATGPDQPTPK